MPPDSGTAGPPASRRSWVPLVLLFLVTATVYVATFDHNALSTDVYGANWTTWKLASTGSPWIDGSRVGDLDPSVVSQMLVIHTPAGHTAFGRFPGVVLASLPAYLLAHPTKFSAVPAGLTAALLTAGSVTLMFAGLRQHVKTSYAVVAAGVFAFATPLWSVSANALWPHTITLLGISGMAWAASSRRWWWAGIFGGITLWGRLHAALIVAILGLAVAWRRRDPRIAIRIGLVSVLALVALCGWVRWMYGTWSPLGAYSSTAVGENAGRYRFDLVNQLGMWVSPDRGILVWTPVLVLLLPALCRSWRGLPDWTRSLLYGGLVYTVVECGLNTFTGGSGFYSYRYGLELLACATPAMTISAAAMGRTARTFCGPLLGIQFIAIALGSLNNGGGVVSEKNVWSENSFIRQVDLIGAPGWILVSLFALLGAAVGQELVRRAAQRSVRYRHTAATSDETTNAS